MSVKYLNLMCIGLPRCLLSPIGTFLASGAQSTFFWSKAMLPKLCLHL